MFKYFFVLGRNHILSVAEILSVLKKFQIKFTIISLAEEILVIETAVNIDCHKLNDTFGGVIKIGQILDETGFDESEEKFSSFFTADNLIGRYLSAATSKLHVGISLYDAGGDKKYLQILSRQLIGFNLQIKRTLGGKNLRVGFVRVKERNLSSVSVVKNKLLAQGVEIVLVISPDKIFMGKTLVVQDFELFGRRDVGRPYLDKRSGIIPTKLARIMVNLSGVSQDGALLDPFCGSGTIIQEAVVLGIKKVTGADISSKAVNDTEKNLDWFFRNFPHYNQSSYNIKLMQTDVSVISQKIPTNSFDAIVTEPFLSPPIFQKPDIKLISQLQIQLADLYLKAFREFHKLLKPMASVIMIFPTFTTYDRIYFLEIVPKILSLGFSQMNFFPVDLIAKYNLKPTFRSTILYGGKTEFINREIVAFKKI